MDKSIVMKVDEYIRDSEADSRLLTSIASAVHGAAVEQNASKERVFRALIKLSSLIDSDAYEVAPRNIKVSYEE